MKISVIIPAYNEEEGIKNVLEELKTYLKENDIQTEIIVVNDGSTDKTKKILENIKNIKLINHPYNKGNGAALKTGIRNALYDHVLFFDADGQHMPKYIKEFLKYSNEYDVIAGARIKGYKGPFIRQPGKKLLHFLANYLSDQKIPDLNCGMRLIKKDILLRFIHIFPNSFSMYTTMSLIFQKEGLNVKYVPIEINKRIGKSMVKPKDAFKMFMLILRTIILFSPLRVFLPVSGLMFGLALISMVLDIVNTNSFNIGEITILFSISSILFFFFGLLSDQVSTVMRERK